MVIDRCHGDDKQMTSAIDGDLTAKAWLPTAYLDSGYLSAAALVVALTTWGSR